MFYCDHLLLLTLRHPSDTLEQHHLTSLDTGKTIPYFNKESRPYMSAKTKQEMVQVRVSFFKFRKSGNL